MRHGALFAYLLLAQWQRAQCIAPVLPKLLRGEPTALEPVGEAEALWDAAVAEPSGGPAAQPAGAAVAETTGEPAAQLAEAAVAAPTAEPAAQPAEAAARPAEAAVTKPAPTAQPAEAAVAEPAGEPAAQPAEAAVAKPAPTARPAEAVSPEVSATAGCGNVTMPVEEGGTPRNISEEERCSLYCLLENVPMEADAMKLARDLHYKKCAVVSNSGAMLRHYYGVDIDKADAVMRFGNPPVDGYITRFVGRKETFRMLKPIPQEEILHLGSFGSGIFLVTDDFARDGPPVARPGVVPLGEMQRSLLQVLQRTFPRFRYNPGHEVTAGMTAITFLLHLCDEVVLYEMIPSPAARSMPWHYWELGGNASHSTWHNSLFFEQALWTSMAGAAGVADTGRVSLQGFSKRPQRCGPRPTMPPKLEPASPPDTPNCRHVSIMLQGRDMNPSHITSRQRCSLYCRLENLVPTGGAWRELMDRVHYKTCAVVSNSGALLKRRYGSAIDAADAIMRFNLAVADTSHAGSKETFRLLNARLQSKAVTGLTLGSLDKGLFLLTDGWPKDHMPVGEPGTLQSEIFAAQPGILPVGEVQQGLMEVLMQTFPEFKHNPGHEVTSGMTGITLMLHLCDEVMLYEMVPSKAARDMPWHYWETWGDAATNTWHNSLSYEYAMWRALAGPNDTSQTGAVRLEGFRRHAAQCRAAG